MSLAGALVAVVAAGLEECERIAALLRASGAATQSAVVDADALAKLSAPGFDAAVLDVGSEPERFVALSTALHNDPRTQGMPLFALADDAMSCESVAGLGALQLVCGAEDVRALRLIRALSDVVATRRATLAAADHARALEERLRIAVERLAVLRTDAQTLTHDARVLCGIVMGFAANLRDGITGPLDSLQRGHVAQILEAASDASALVERFGGAARAHTELPADSPNGAQAARRTARRTLFDFVELTRTTWKLFEKVAEQKSIGVAFEAPEAVLLWGDAMQIKQVVTNLLVNALKFTPARGRVTVSVKSVAPSGPAAGPSARQQAELMVCDDGPGIPAGDRERVFERGVRLSRDERVPGTGIGLAVVREVIATHGGTARAEEAPGGGAAFVIRLPLDMRSRRESSLLLVDDPGSAQRILEVLKGRRDWARDASKADGAVSMALAACRAVVVIPRSARVALDELLGPIGSLPPAPPDGGPR